MPALNFSRAVEFTIVSCILSDYWFVAAGCNFGRTRFVLVSWVVERNFYSLFGWVCFRLFWTLLRLSSATRAP